MEEKKSIYFQRPNKVQENISTLPSAEVDSEEESFSDVFKLKKSAKRGLVKPDKGRSKVDKVHSKLDKDEAKLKSEQPSQVDWKHLKSQLRKVELSSSSASEDKSDCETSEITDEIYDQILKCPLCSKKIQENSNAWKVNHLKQCAIKYKVSTQNFLKALKLQIKQDEEREALGLPCVKLEKQSAPRRQTSSTLVKQMSSKDPSIQLAMALSASLQEAQEAAIIEETSNLFEAGLETEALDRCKSLEKLPLVQLKAPPAIRDKKSRTTTVPVLLTRSKEDRDRLVSEKVVNFILTQEETFLPPLPSEPYQLKSKSLRKCVVADAPSWHLNQMESSEDSQYYTSTYLQYGRPEQIGTCSENKRATFSEQQYSQIELKILQELEAQFLSMKLKGISDTHGKTSSVSSNSSTSTQNKRKPTTKENDKENLTFNTNLTSQMKELRLLSKNLSALIGTQTLSDITIYSKEEYAIPSHKIILLSRNPSLLKDIIREDDNEGKTNEMLMWNMEKHLCQIVLEYLYSGVIILEKIHSLNDSDLEELKQFCKTYQIRVLYKIIENKEAGRSDQVVSDEKSEHFDDEVSNKPKTLSSWLDGLKCRDRLTWKKNFRNRFNRPDPKLRLHDLGIEENKQENKLLDSVSIEGVSTGPEDIYSEATDIDSVSTKLLEQEEVKDGEAQRLNETISAGSGSSVSSRCNAEEETKDLQLKVESKKPDVTKDNVKPSLYRYDSDIYDQETLASSKTSDSEIINSDTEVRMSLKSINSMYDKNTLCNISSDNVKHTEASATPVKDTLSQHTLTGSPELFSESDEEDNDRNAMNVPNSKSTTQSNLHKLMNMIEKDIEPTCPSDQITDAKKRKRASPSPDHTMKRSKHTSNKNGSNTSTSNITTQVNREKELNIFKDNLESKFSKKYNSSSPCVAGNIMKSRPSTRDRFIDYDKIEVDTSVPPRQLNLTVENLTLFDEINESSNDQPGFLFEKENVIVKNKNSASSHASSLFFETLTSQNKETCTKRTNLPKTIAPLTKHAVKDTKSQISGALGSKRKRVQTPDFLKKRFEEDIIEIKSSSSTNSDCYPTKDLSQSHRFSQKLENNKSLTRHRNFLSLPLRKSVVPKSPLRHSKKATTSTKLFDTDSSDEFSMTTKRKVDQILGQSIDALSPIARVSERHVSLSERTNDTKGKTSPGKSPLKAPITKRFEHIPDSSDKNDSVVSRLLTKSNDNTKNELKSKLLDPISTPHSNLSPLPSYAEISRVRKVRTFMGNSSSKSDTSGNSESCVLKPRNSRCSNIRNRPKGYPDCSSSGRRGKRRDTLRHRRSPSIQSSLDETNVGVVSNRGIHPKSDNTSSSSHNEKSPVDSATLLREVSPASKVSPSLDSAKEMPSVGSPSKESPSRTHNEFSPQFFSPPMYVWDDPAYEDNCMPPYEDTNLPQYTNDLVERNEKESAHQSKRTSQEPANPSLSHSSKLVHSEDEETHRVSFEEKQSSLAQSFHNSQFMAKFKEYFSNNTKHEAKKPVEERHVMETSSPAKSSSQPHTTIVALQNQHLSPDVIIRQPEGLSDTSSCESLWRQRCKVYEKVQNKTKLDAIQPTDCWEEKAQVPSSRSPPTSPRVRRTSEDTSKQNRLKKSTICTNISSSESNNDSISISKDRRKSKSSNILSADDDRSLKEDDVNATFPKDDTKNKNQYRSKDMSKNANHVLSDSEVESTSPTLQTYTTAYSKRKTTSGPESYSSDDIVEPDSRNTLIAKKLSKIRNSVKKSSISTSDSESDLEPNNLFAKRVSKIRNSFNKSPSMSSSNSGKTLESDWEPMTKQKSHRSLKERVSSSQPVSTNSSHLTSNLANVRYEDSQSDEVIQPRRGDFVTSGKLREVRPRHSVTNHSQLYTGSSPPSTSQTQHTKSTISHSQHSLSRSPLRSTQAASDTARNPADTQPRHSVRKSLNFGQLLEESLTVDESLLGHLEAEHGVAGAKDTPACSNVRTPASSSRLSAIDSSAVTPLADYSRMETPALKKELNKYGLKPGLTKAKAKLLLRYIYNQTHPYVESDEEPPDRGEKRGKSRKTNPEPKDPKHLPEASEPVPEPKISHPQRKKANPDLKKSKINPGASTSSQSQPVISEPSRTIRLKSNVETSRVKDRYEANVQSGNEGESDSETSFTSLSEGPVYEESILFESNMHSSPTHDAPPVSQGPQFSTEVDRILRSPENYRKILQYEPVWLEHLHGELKRRGVRSNVKQLMDYLDEKCITFRTVRQKPRVKQTAKSKKIKLASQTRRDGGASQPMTSSRAKKTRQYQSQPVSSAGRNV